MAFRNVLFEDNPILRKKSKVVTEFDEKLVEILEDMKETMHKFDGVGLAAVQVGILKRIVIVEINGFFLECINPEIIKKSGSQENEEGCLSVRNASGLVKRPYAITIKAQNRNGEPFVFSCEKMSTVVLCHEIDHLDGILFIDKVEK